MRVVLLLLLLLLSYHCFIIYNNGWSMPDGVSSNEIYAWVAKFSYSFLLEGFVFIFGYVFAYQKSLNRYTRLKDVVANKSKRLLLPSAVFSCIYLLVFYTGDINISLVYSILEGVSHMWYLPMLFWTFIICALLIKYVSNKWWRLAVFCLMCLVSYVPLPLRFNNAMYYALFFYVGYEVYHKRNLISSMITGRNILSLLFGFVAIFILLTTCREWLHFMASSSDFIIYKIAGYSMATLVRTIYATLGLFGLYMMSQYVATRVRIPYCVIMIGTLGMGIYLIHQFVIMIIYYKTSLPSLLDGWLPWASFIITLVSSVVLTYILKKIPVIKSCI